MFLDKDDIGLVNTIECDNKLLVDMCMALEDLKLALTAGYISLDMFMYYYDFVNKVLLAELQAEKLGGNMVVYDSNIDNHQHSVTVYVLNNDVYDNVTDKYVTCIFDSEVTYHNLHNYYPQHLKYKRSLMDMELPLNVADVDVAISKIHAYTPMELVINSRLGSFTTTVDRLKA